MLWDGKPLHTEADAVGSTPLVGIVLLDTHSLYMEIANSGRVAIQPIGLQTGLTQLILQRAQAMVAFPELGHEVGPCRFP